MTIELLDCTLREGTQITKIEKNNSLKILESLAGSNLDYAEIGFLNDTEDTGELCKILQPNTVPVIFANFNKCDFSNLIKCQEEGPQAIRVGFKINDIQTSQAELKDTLLTIKKKGYRLFLQPCHTLSYDEQAFIELINFTNDINPYSFAIVDSYGSMFDSDIKKYIDLINKYLTNNIKLDFHSHNNLQLSLLLTNLVLTSTDHDIIIDSSLYGLGRGGGNLPTEIIAAYLNKNFNKNYDLDTILDTIEKNILLLQKNVNWGYSLKTLEYGLKDIHP